MDILKYFKRDPQPQAPPMTCICPNCHHEDRRPKNLARKIGGALGAVAGAACGVYGILGTDRIGMGDVRFPGDMEDFQPDLISIASATIRGLLGATTGFICGVRLGELIDAHLLENQTCRQCGYPFSGGMDYAQRPTPFEAASQQSASAGFARPSGSAFFPNRLREPPLDMDLEEDEDLHSNLPPFGFGLVPRDLALNSTSESGPHPDSDSDDGNDAGTHPFPAPA